MAAAEQLALPSGLAHVWDVVWTMDDEEIARRLLEYQGPFRKGWDREIAVYEEVEHPPKCRACGNKRAHTERRIEQRNGHDVTRIRWICDHCGTVGLPAIQHPAQVRHWYGENERKEADE